MTITLNDRQRLLDLIEIPSVKTKMPLLIDKLSTRLGEARSLPPEQIKKSVITMNSKVRLKDLRSGSEAEITITYPRDANPR